MWCAWHELGFAGEACQKMLTNLCCSYLKTGDYYVTPNTGLQVGIQINNNKINICAATTRTGVIQQLYRVFPAK